MVLPSCTLKRWAQKGFQGKQIWDCQSSLSSKFPLQGSLTLPVCPQTREFEDDRQNQKNMLPTLSFHGKITQSHILENFSFFPLVLVLLCIHWVLSTIADTPGWLSQEDVLGKVCRAGAHNAGSTRLAYAPAAALCLWLCPWFIYSGFTLWPWS